jgi:glycosyltransferase involved in cell wall biosynthesis
MFNFNNNVKDLHIVFAYKNFGKIKGISHIGLGVAALTSCNTLQQNNIKAEIWSILTPEDLLSTLETYENVDKITHIIISAPWIPSSTIAQVVCKYKHIHFTTLSHSGIGFLAADRNGIKLLRESVILQKSVKNYQIAGNSLRFAQWASTVWGVDVGFLPNLYDITGMNYIPKKWNKKEPLKISCFGAIRPLKNQITAAGAAALIAKKLDVPTELWLNGGRSEGGGFGVDAIRELVGNIPQFSIKLKQWAPWQEFRDFIGTMHLNLQPSYTESFNMVCADSIFNGVPVVGSEAITWLPKSWQGNVDDAADIAKKGIELIQNPYLVEEQQHALKKYVKDGIKQWKKYLNK